MLANVGRQFDGEQRAFLAGHGVIGESLTSTLNRWTWRPPRAQPVGPRGRLGDEVVAWRTRHRHCARVGGDDDAGVRQEARQGLGELDERDRHPMERKGHQRG